MCSGGVDPNPTTTLHHVELGVVDLERSLGFWTGLLGLPVAAGAPATDEEAWLDAGSGLVHLVRRPRPEPAGWQVVNHQSGLRHVGFTVADVDAWAERVRAAGVPFAIAPMTALGEVRIVFFSDPDGALVELVAGRLVHTTVWNAELVAERDAAAAPGEALVLDHAALTTADLDRALATYRDDLALPALGQVPHPGDERGYVRSYLAAGRGTLELFSYDVAPLPAAADDPGRTGLRAVGLTTGDPELAERRLRARASALEGPGRRLLDADGTTLALLPPGFSPAAGG